MNVVSPTPLYPPLIPPSKGGQGDFENMSFFTQQTTNNKQPTTKPRYHEYYD